ncbi:hypothetical protein SeLEV6574_g03045 [Synchytrium endobioticum]|uniref:CBS domain-containing protein n=1 Tax=Synchytrium endobioticum TaxID=286115 RepID=A0A507D614_9FUNG|nr:hypothetical protein SeLEV6574_g03045 [Synchytrium endobioticum]
MMNFFTSNGIVKESPANELTLSTNNNYHHLQQQLQSREPLTLEFDGLTNTSCYDVLSVSYKVICFDTSLPVKKALAALLSHGVESAPLWDSIKQCFAGMLTVSDFIHLIMYYYKRSSYDAAIEEVEQLEIRTLREIEAKVGVLPPGMYIHPARTLYEAGSLLLKHGVHRIALLDRAGESETMVGIITHRLAELCQFDDETDIKELFAASNGYRCNTIDTSSEAAKRFLARKQPSLHRDATNMPKVTVECSSSKWNAALVNFGKRAFKRSWSDATLGDAAILAPVTLKKQRSNLNCQSHGGNGPFIKRKMHLEGVGKENIPPWALSTSHIP